MNQDLPESVWDYPRPPRLEVSLRHLMIVHGGISVAETSRSLRVLETSHPPVYYIPQQDIAMEFLRQSSRRGTFCEYKGVATYWDLQVPGAKLVEDVAWSYERPSSSCAALKDFLAFYAAHLDECSVDGERVQPQPGDFYGGWITSHVKGPFKGAPGTKGW
jgi:uncharacterized protein (DUF427 family)